jgi:hypothetical protein
MLHNLKQLKQENNFEDLFYLLEALGLQLLHLTSSQLAWHYAISSARNVKFENRAFPRFSIFCNRKWK